MCVPALRALLLTGSVFGLQQLEGAKEGFKQDRWKELADSLQMIAEELRNCGQQA